MKNLLNLNGAQVLSKNEQQSIQGGDALCYGGCVGKNEGDSCYTATGACRTRTSGVCTNFGGVLGCKPN